MQKYLNELQECTSLKNLTNCIQNIFFQQTNSDYFPAIFEYKVNSVLKNPLHIYFKISLIPQDIVGNRYWQKGYLEESVPMQMQNIEDVTCHNLLTKVNFKGKKIYAVNRHLTTVNTVRMTNDVENNILIEFYKNSKMPLLHSALQGNSIFIYRPFVEDILQNIFHNKYAISLDYYICSSKLKLVIKEYDNCRVERVKDNIQLYSSCTIEKSMLQDQIKTEENQLFVYNLLEKNFTPLCIYPLQSKADMGILFFSLEILPFLKENFYNYGMYLVNKKTKQSILVDILEECVSFWKSEFLKLNELDQRVFIQYNQKVCPKNFISQAMYMWQIEGRVNYNQYMAEYQNLAEYLLCNYAEQVLSAKLSFFPPQNIKDLQIFMQKLLKLFHISLKNLKLKEEQYTIFYNILQNKIDKNLDLLQYYNGFCYTIQRRIEDGIITM